MNTYSTGTMIVVFLALMANLTFGLVTINCCQQKYTSFGDSCSSSGTTVGNDTYYCVDTSVYGCSDCSVNSDTSYTMCSSCCVTDKTACITSTGSMTTSTLLTIMVLSLAFLACILVFGSTEFIRDDGLSFREAYLLPIPLVAVDQILKLDTQDSQDNDDDDYYDSDGHNEGDGEKGYGGGSVTKGTRHTENNQASDVGESSDAVSFGSETSPREIASHRNAEPIAQATAHIYSPAIPVAEPTEARGSNVYYH